MELPGSAFASRAHHGPGPGPDAGEAHCQAQAAVSLRLAHMQLASPGRGKSRMS